MATTSADWDQRYRDADTPWDSGIPSRELARVLDDERIGPCRAAELGCGTGTNALFLAERGFEVTAFDLSEVALAEARRKAAERRATIRFVQADLCHFREAVEPFDFVFDRGCFHCARRVDQPGFKETLRRVTRAGTRYLVLTGNANEQTDEGPPRLRASELCADLEDLFDIAWIRAVRFEDAGGKDGPLGWSCFSVRRGEG